MADKILVNTDLLEKCAKELQQAASGFGDAASILAGLNTSEEWWTKMGRFSALKLQDEGSSAQMGDAGAAVRSLAGVMRRYDGRATTLGNNVSKAASMFKNIEKSLQGKAQGQTAGDEGSIINKIGMVGRVAADAVAAVTKESDKPENNWSWWDLIKSVGGKIGPAGGFFFETADLFKNIAEDAMDGWGVAKYLAKGGKPVAKWIKAILEGKSWKEWFGVKDYTGGFWGNFWKQSLDPINVAFSGITTYIENLKEYSEGKISRDRMFVEWSFEWMADIGKTALISATGGALATSVVAPTLIAAGITIPGGVVVVGCTCVVAGVYCFADWACKKIFDQGIVQSAGKLAGTIYDGIKTGAKKAKKVISKSVKKVAKAAKETGKAICDGAKALWKGVFG